MHFGAGIERKSACSRAIRNSYKSLKDGSFLSFIALADTYKRSLARARAWANRPTVFLQLLVRFRLTGFWATSSRKHLNCQGIKKPYPSFFSFHFVHTATRH